MFQIKLNGFEKEAHFDNTSFLVEDIRRSLTFFLNGIIYFLLHQLMHLDILYFEKVLTYLC